MGAVMAWDITMPLSEFAQIKTWVFDLDNTLYDPRTRLLDQINLRTTEFVMRVLRMERAAAEALRLRYWRECGATVTGLMDYHNVAPKPFLEDVHQVSLAALKPDPRLAARLAALPGRRIVHTNGTAEHAHRVLRARGLGGVMHAIYGIEHAGFRPKPEPSAFRAVYGLDGIDTRSAALFDDDPRNLRTPFAWGMRTVLVGGAGLDAAYVQHHAPDLSGFLDSILT